MDESREVYLPLGFAFFVSAIAVTFVFWGWVGLFWLALSAAIAGDTTNQIKRVVTILQQEQSHSQ